MTVDGIGTRSSPIFIHDSEEEIIQELDHQQFYGEKHDTTQYSTHHTSSTAGKRKSREDDELVADEGNSHLPPSTSLENRLSQPESKKARKRKRKLKREVLEREKNKSLDPLDNPTSYPPVAGPSQPVASLQERMDEERLTSQILEEVILLEKQTERILQEFGPISRSPSPSTFESNWVSSMVNAGEFPRCKKAKTSTTPNFSPRSAPKPLPAFPPTTASSEILPPIHIHPDLVFSTEAPAPTRLPPQAPSQTGLPQTIGMKPDQDPNGIHGIFRVTNDTREGGAGMKKRRNAHVPNPTRTLVMEQLPKTHRTLNFVDNWCRSACGVPPIHLFVDPPSATALIEFASADLARKAWASPRLGQHLLGTKSHLLKGVAREDLIKVWWYRVAGVGASAAASVSELEEGEIEENRVTENKMQPSPRKESKKERKARLLRERDAMKMATMKENQQQQKQKQKQVENSSIVAHSNNPQPGPSSVAHTTPLPPAPAPSPALSSDPSSTQPWSPQVQPLKQSYSPYTTSRTAVGSSLAPGYDDSASIASSCGGSSPTHHLAGKTAIVVSPSRSVVVATTVGQADDLADYSEVDMDMDVDVDLPPDYTVASSNRPLPTKKATSSTAVQRQTYPVQPTTKDDALSPSIPAKPSTGKVREEARSKQQSQAWPYPQSHLAPTPTARRAVMPPFISISNNYPVHQSSPASLPSASSTSISQVSNSSQGTSTSSIPSKTLPLGPIPASNISLSSQHKVTGPIHSVDAKPAISVKSKLDKQISESRAELVGSGNAAAPASLHPASSSGSTVRPSVAATLSNSDSVGQAMEENLRQLVFASKRARASGIQAHLSTSQPLASVSVDVNMTPPLHNNLAAEGLTSNATSVPAQAAATSEIINLEIVEKPVPAPSSATIPPVSSSTALNHLSAEFEDLAVTFITQTIENFKANNNNQQQADPHCVDSSLGSTLTSASATPPPSTPSPTTPSSTAVVGFPLVSASSNASAGGVINNKPPLVNSSLKLIKSELSARQRRLEKHLQESKALMERISIAKTKQEKELLLKIMNEKMRLFEEENKACEKKIARADNSAFSNKKPSKNRAHKTTTFQFQQWPTTQSDSILVLSDDED